MKIGKNQFLQIKLNTSRIKEDLLFIGLPINAIIVSDRLKSNLANNGITGRVFTDVDDYSIVAF